MTWYNPSISIIEEAEDNSGVNIWPKKEVFYSPLQDIRGYPDLCRERRAQEPTIWSLTLLPKNSANLVFISRQHIEHCATQKQPRVCVSHPHSTCTVKRVNQTKTLKIVEEEKRKPPSSNLQGQVCQIYSAGRFRSATSVHWTLKVASHARVDRIFIISEPWTRNTVSDA